MTLLSQARLLSRSRVLVEMNEQRLEFPCRRNPDELDE
jgi:hypothetical protein